MKTCIGCQHPRASHDHLGRCRLGGCGCPGFDEGAPGAKPAGGRHISFFLPDGYTASVALIPPGGPALAVELDHPAPIEPEES